jgi:hypothetical protein
MQKRYVVVGAVMLVASAVSYGLVQMTEASPATVEMVATAGSSIGIAAAAAPLVLPVTPAVEFATESHSATDAAMLLATGATLIGIAAGVRRHTC